MHARSYSRTQSSSHACKITSVPSDIFFVKKKYFSVWSLYRLQLKKGNQNQLGRGLPFAFALTCYKIYRYLNKLYTIAMFSDVCMLVLPCVDCMQQKTLSSLLKLPGGFWDVYTVISDHRLVYIRGSLGSRVLIISDWLALGSSLSVLLNQIRYSLLFIWKDMYSQGFATQQQSILYENVIYWQFVDKYMHSN